MAQLYLFLLLTRKGTVASIHSFHLFNLYNMRSNIHKKLSLLSVSLLFMTVISYAQPSIDSINWQLRALFGNLAKPAPPRLFNWDMAVHTVDSSLFVKVNYADTLSLSNWVEMYTEMRNSAYDTIPVKTVDNVMDPTYQFGADTINMLLMYYDYYIFNDQALTTGLYFDFDTINTILTDKYPRPGFPYYTKTVFAATPNKNLASRAKVIFRIGVNNLLNDNFNPLGAGSGNLIRIDFGDSTGWHYLIPGVDNYVEVNYHTAGKHPILTEVVDNRYFKTKAASVSYMSSKKTRDTPFDEADANIALPGLNIAVFEPCNSIAPEFARTLIYLEGFDIGDFLPNSNRNAQSIYEDQIVTPGLSDLRNFGYRIFVVDWANSRIDMRQNAKNLNDFLEYLKCGNIIPDNNMEEFVIIGESMGGIVANYALLQQETGQYISHCKGRSLHNTRLLLTLDSPFEGAHVPMGLQRISNYIINHLTGGLAIPFLPFATKLFLKNNNLLAEGVAAKQLLMYHYSTASLLGPVSYYSHNERDNFIQDQNNMGSHPKYCKLMAASNGNMMGFGQTRVWDGNDRVDNDRLLRIKYTVYGTILKHKLNLAGVNMEMNSDPNGNGDLANLSFGTWSIKIKLKWWGIKIYTGFNSLCNKDWDGDMLPLTNAAGGLIDGNSSIADLFANKTYQGNGNWVTNGTTKWGIDAFAGTDGFHFCFVPVTSAFDYGINVNTPFDLLDMDVVFNWTPMYFHAFYGMPGNAQIFPPSTNFNTNPYVNNNHHTFVRNDVLRDNGGIDLQYPTCPVVGANIPHNVRFLNREIGDNEIYLENRYLPWDASCSMPDITHVNVRSEHYNYPNLPVYLNTMTSVYSNVTPYIIDNAALATFNTTTGNVDYQPPFSGPFITPVFTFVPCCNNYYRPTSKAYVTEYNALSDKMAVYPNPVQRDFILEFTPNGNGVMQYSIVDLLGKVVMESSVQIHEANKLFHLDVQLPATLPSGHYIISARLNGQIFANKLIVQ